MKFLKNRSTFLAHCGQAILLVAACRETCGADWNLLTGPGSPGNSNIKLLDATTGVLENSFLAYSPGVNLGFRVAAGDVTGDGTPDVITGLGAGGAPHVKVFDGVTLAEVRSFDAYSGFTGGVYVAAGDLTDDGRDEIITGAGAGGSTHVKVFDGVTNAELRSFFAYPGVNVEVRVAAGDVNGDGFDDLITGLGEGVASHVKVFSGVDNSLLSSFFAYGPSFTGGVFVAAGDVNDDGLADVITGAGVAGSTHVKAFSGADGSELRSFLAYAGVNSEVRVGAGDVNGDGVDDILTGLGPGGSGSTHVKAFNGVTNVELGSFFAYSASFAGGVYVAGIPAVPEPSALALASAALGLLAARRRGQMRK